MWENVVKRGRTQMAIWRMRVACWIPKATDTHSEYVTLISLPQQQYLHERASILRHTYIACLDDVRKMEVACVYSAVRTGSFVFTARYRLGVLCLQRGTDWEFCVYSAVRTGSFVFTARYRLGVLCLQHGKDWEFCVYSAVQTGSFVFTARYRLGVLCLQRGTDWSFAFTAR